MKDRLDDFMNELDVRICQTGFIVPERGAAIEFWKITALLMQQLSNDGPFRVISREDMEAKAFEQNQV